MTEPSVLVVGETLIDFIPDSAGPLAEVETFGRRAGGAPANVAVGLARLDDTPWPCTTLSTDPFGEFLAARVEDEGISDQFITRVDNSTALAFVSHGDDALGTRQWAGSALYDDGELYCLYMATGDRRRSTASRHGFGAHLTTGCTRVRRRRCRRLTTSGAVQRGISPPSRD